MQDLEAVLKIDEDIKKAQCALFWVDVDAHEANLKVSVRARGLAHTISRVLCWFTSRGIMMLNLVVLRMYSDSWSRL